MQLYTVKPIQVPTVGAIPLPDIRKSSKTKLNEQNAENTIDGVIKQRGNNCKENGNKKDNLKIRKMQFTLLG